jgi:hypothetical protein
MTASSLKKINFVLTFYKIDDETGDWYQYYNIPKTRGTIYFIKGNIRF